MSLLLIATAFVTGCSSVQVGSDVAPNARLSALRSFYVVKDPPDGRGIEKLLANRLVAMGFQAESGAATVPPRPVDAVVTYKDRWMWDITMYMLELKVDLNDPANKNVIASGHSYRTSLARRTPEAMVSEVLSEIFKPRP